MTSPTDNYEGGCTCGHVRYRVTREPLIVHCCHCRWCQRQTGALFALNALVETESVELLAGSVLEAMVPSPSGKGQQIARCPQCKVALWSNYYMGGLFDLIRFIRVGTLDEPDRLPPDVHIYTESKQPWVVIPPQDHAVTEYYDTLETWSQESLDRRDKLWLLHSQA